MSFDQLVNSYTDSEINSRSVKITHPEFENVPSTTQKFIQKVVNKIMRSDFDIVRFVFDEKLVIFLRLLEGELENIACQDKHLQTLIINARTDIENTLNGSYLREKDHNWLLQIGFTPADIFKLASDYNLVQIRQEIQNDLDEYRVIFGDYKYLVKILKGEQGYSKLKRLKEFFRTYKNQLTEFNGSQLSKIVYGKGWEEKLAYFENEENLIRLTKAGMTFSQIAQACLRTNWRTVLDSEQ